MANNEESDVIEEALHKALLKNSGHKDGDILVEWIVLAYVTNPDREQGEYFPRFVSNGYIPQHHVLGLLEIDKRRLLDEL